MNNTYIHKPIKQKKWYLINAKTENLGRLSTYISKLLIGKNNSTYTPHLNTEINIIIINAKYITITGKKRYQKKYQRHSGKPGGLKTESFIELNQRQPNRIIEHSIKGMLPKNTLGKQLFKQINIYPEDIHPHAAQKPAVIKLN
uniref:Ribosomal protein L13 n=1 Tax=Dicranema revolutum TaxID=239144 RepID=A0A4D6WT10_9FLOR|nr:ribosomal protein L13 [Dicranema revolutum]